MGKKAGEVSGEVDMLCCKCPVCLLKSWTFPINHVPSLMTFFSPIKTKVMLPQSPARMFCKVQTLPGLQGMSGTFRGEDFPVPIEKIRFQQLMEAGSLAEGWELGGSCLPTAF